MTLSGKYYNDAVLHLHSLRIKDAITTADITQIVKKVWNQSRRPFKEAHKAVLEAGMDAKDSSRKKSKKGKKASRF
jgi:hypothetical protein